MPKSPNLPQTISQQNTNLLPRISHVEQQIGAGLIEEIIQVAEAELKLVDELAKAKVYVTIQSLVSRLTANTFHRWEELEEKPQPGQWTYFERVN